MPFGLCLVTLSAREGEHNLIRIVNKHVRQTWLGSNVAIDMPGYQIVDS